MVVSYDQHPGLATRRQAKKAAAVTVAFAGSKLPGAKHAGAPVRHSVRRLVRNTAGDDSARRRAAEVFGIDPSRRVVVAIDPAVTAHAHSDETGIVVAGIGADGRVYVLEDLSGVYPAGHDGFAPSSR